ncbi:hypothetical protein PT277_07185 [Acetobacteraceae bacterium ESL0709]|nr:hypothetical protein [Acetobacteraceae bacterium ESL0697]MDF7678467.1 hypothetical protein [Acetobacteraceae bacterium ESL0709]
MTRLTAKERRALPDSAFAGPNRTYPVPDRTHAANAKARATQAAEEGRIPVSEEKAIDEKADEVLEEDHARDS